MTYEIRLHMRIYHDFDGRAVCLQNYNDDDEGKQVVVSLCAIVVGRCVEKKEGRIRKKNGVRERKVGSVV